MDGPQDRHTESASSRSRGDISGTDPPPSKRRRKAPTMEALLAKEVGLMRGGSGDPATSFVGSASGIHFIRSVYGSVAAQEAVTTSPETNLVPGEDDRLEAPIPSGASKRIWHDSEVANDVQSSIDRHPTFEELMDWSESFFDNWHPPFPVLHAPSILEAFDKLSQGGLVSLPTWDAVVIRAIISLSLADRRQTDKVLSRPIPSNLVFSTFDEAHEAVLPALTRPSTTNGLQAVVCVQLFLVSMLRLNTASRLGGLIIQMSFQLGLHRCPARYQTFSQSDCQLRKRIFWSIYCIERYICQAMGLPLTIRDDDADVCHLNVEVHRPPPAKASSTTTERDEARKDASPIPDGRLQLLAFLSQYAQLRGSIMELRNKRVEERDKDPDRAVFINAKLMHWWNQVEDFLDQDETSCPVSSLHKGILEILKHEATIMLHRPMLALRKATASYESAVHACIGAAKSIISALHSLLRERTSADGQTIYAPMMWPSFTWAAWMSAFILLYGTAEGIVTGHTAGRNVDKALEVLDKLAARGSVWPEASAVAIQDLRSILTKRYDIPKTPTGGAGNENASHAQARQTQGPAVNRGDTPGMRRAASTTSPTSPMQRDAPQTSSRTRPSMSSATDNVGGAIIVPENNSVWSGIDSNSSSYRQPMTRAPQSYGASSMQESFPLNTDLDPLWRDANLFPKDIPPQALATIDPFQGFDIPFWFGQDNYVAWMGNES